MNIQLYSDLSEFLAIARPFLLQDEAANNLSLGLLDSMERQPPRRRNRPMMATVVADGAIELVGMMTPPRKMVLAGSETAVSAATALATHLHEAGKTVPAVFGPTPLAHVFAEQWCGLEKRPYRQGKPQAIHKLTHVNDNLTFPAGTFRLPAPEELELITDWIFNFQRDAEVDHMPSLAVQVAAQLIQNRDLYVWADETDTPKGMTAKSRPTQNGIAINQVYTPHEARGKGYATACVAHLSQQLLDEGYHFCTLFTDLNNPISNHVYQKIGYEKLVSFQDYFWDVE